MPSRRRARGLERQPALPLADPAVLARRPVERPLTSSDELTPRWPALPPRAERPELTLDSLLGPATALGHRAAWGRSGVHAQPLAPLLRAAVAVHGDQRRPEAGSAEFALGRPATELRDERPDRPLQSILIPALPGRGQAEPGRPPAPAAETHHRSVKRLSPAVRNSSRAGQTVRPARNRPSSASMRSSVQRGVALEAGQASPMRAAQCCAPPCRVIASRSARRWARRNSRYEGHVLRSPSSARSSRSMRSSVHLIGLMSHELGS